MATRWSHHAGKRHKEHLARKERDGKTKKGALRCLKRYLARRFHRILSLPALTPQCAHGELGEIPPHPRRASTATLSRSPLRRARCPASPNAPPDERPPRAPRAATRRLRRGSRRATGRLRPWALRAVAWSHRAGPAASRCALRRADGRRDHHGSENGLVRAYNTTPVPLR